VIFRANIFYTEKNNGGNLQNVMVAVLENETNTAMTITAPGGRIELDTTNRQMICI